MNVLLVRQILEVRILVNSLATSRVQSVTSAVLIRAVCHVCKNGYDRKNVGGENRTHSERIQRCLICFEELGCDNVRHAVGDEDQRVHCDFLRMSAGENISIVGFEMK